jgi:hypothetical protein
MRGGRIGAEVRYDMEISMVVQMKIEEQSIRKGFSEGDVNTYATSHKKGGRLGRLLLLLNTVL